MQTAIMCLTKAKHGTILAMFLSTTTRTILETGRTIGSIEPNHQYKRLPRAACKRQAGLGRLKAGYL